MNDPSPGKARYRSDEFKQFFGKLLNQICPIGRYGLSLQSPVFVDSKEKVELNKIYIQHNQKVDFSGKQTGFPVLVSYGVKENRPELHGGRELSIKTTTVNDSAELKFLHDILSHASIDEICRNGQISPNSKDWLDPHGRQSFLIRPSSVEGKVTVCFKHNKTVQKVMMDDLKDAISFLREKGLITAKKLETAAK